MTDIPEDVMKAAGEVWRAMGFVNDRFGQREFIARAMMEARDKAREDAAERVKMRAVFLSGKASADRVQGMLEAAAILVIKGPKP